MKDLLAFADSHDAWGVHFGFAARLAVSLDARLTGVNIYPTPSLPGGFYGAADTFAIILESVRKAETDSHAAGNSFIDWARNEGVRAAAWQVAEGNPGDVLQRLGNRHDLLVVARNAGITDDYVRLGQILVKCGLPLLLLPPSWTQPPQFDCIALAWNGTAEALRAIHAAQPLLQRARRIVILRGELRDAYAEIGWLPPFDLSAYLAFHEWEADVQGIAESGDGAGPALLEAAHLQRADLLVMGGYGRSRFSEWVFGGATRHVLEQSSLPVLLRH
jgi:nucleotide-binding universal stress UspA family protein